VALRLLTIYHLSIFVIIYFRFESVKNVYHNILISAWEYDKIKMIIKYFKLKTFKDISLNFSPSACNSGCHLYFLKKI